jgi:rhodanese-related sulfurtransferase
MAYHFLDGRGYKKLWRYSGGLSDWEQAGYPLEGELVPQPPAD